MQKLPDVRPSVGHYCLAHMEAFLGNGTVAKGQPVPENHKMVSLQGPGTEERGTSILPALWPPCQGPQKPFQP